MSLRQLPRLALELFRYHNATVDKKRRHQMQWPSKYANHSIPMGNWILIRMTDGDCKDRIFQCKENKTQFNLQRHFSGLRYAAGCKQCKQKWTMLETELISTEIR
ncbi:unnamed protein product [Arctogadus glacialis]